jgi:hypothetical protein
LVFFFTTLRFDAGVGPFFTILGSADEHHHDESLTDAQRAWVRDFSARWEAVTAAGRN